jgi:DinB superfamily
MLDIMNNILYGPPAATLAILINDKDAHDFLDPEDILKGINSEQAATTFAGLPYTIAEILAHTNANLLFNIVLLRDRREVKLEPWPKVDPNDWETLKAEFIDHLKILVQLSLQLDLDTIIYAETSTEPAWTVGYKLAASVAKHTAYHLGQIALIKRLIA